MKRIIRLIFSILLIGHFPNDIKAQEKISITDFGYEQGKTKNILPAIYRALEYCQNRENVVLSFPKDRYDFWPITLKGENRIIGFDLKNHKNLTIDGNNSSFIFHGKMQIAEIDSSSQITFKNFSVDWDRPFISQAEIVQSTDSYLDVKIDKEKYPFVIENDTILFVGENWKLPVLNTYNNLYDPINKEIIYQTWDNPLGDIFSKKAVELSEGIVRFYGTPKMNPDPGSLVSLFHLRYAIVGFEIKNSKQVLLKDLQIYHALSHGVLGLRSEDITMDNASMVVNDNKGRVFSIIADASHFLNCKGTINIENCAHTGQGDDFINVHGTNVKILSKLNQKSLEVSDRGGFNNIGDEIWFVDKVSAQRKDSSKIETIEPILDGRKIKSYKVTFNKPLPSSIQIDDFIENKTWTASLILRNCQILKRHRARGILVTTPKKVLIENNYFRTAGTAILIEGDLDYWYESGGHKNLIIRNNEFDNCLSSGNAHGSRAEWGEAIITITPSHKPKTVDEPSYHQNIQIVNNIFNVFDAPLLRARSVDGLIFSNNKINKTYDYKPYTWQKSAFLLDGCRNVKIEENSLDNEYLTRDVLLQRMKLSDVQIGKDQPFRVAFDNNLNTYHNW